MTTLGGDDSRILREIARRLGVDSSDGGGPTVGEVAAAYDDEEVRFMPPRSAHTRRSQLAPVVARLGKRPVLALTVAELRAYAEDRLGDPGVRAGTQVSPTTVNNERKAIMRACSWAVERDPPLLPDVPRALRQWRPPAARERHGALRLEDVERLVAALPPWLGTLCVVLLYTGQRVHAALQMRWADVDFRTGRIRPALADSRTKKRGKPRLLSPALAALQAHRDRQIAAHGSLPEYVFASFAPRLRRRRGTVPYSYSYAANTFRETARREGVTTEDGYACLHHLKHGFFVEALHRWGLSIKVAMRRAGLNTLQMAMRYGKVGDLEDDDAQDAAEERIARQRELAKQKGPRGVVRTDADRHRREERAAPASALPVPRRGS